jgi:hypothetical protein
VTFSEDVDAGCVDDDPLIFANLDIDEDECDGLDAEVEAEPDKSTPVKIKRGIQRDYMRAIQDRLKIEVAGKTKALEKTWLLDYLQTNDGWIRKEQALSFFKKLNSPKQSPSTYSDTNIRWHNQNKFYYRDIKVWLPDILLMGGCCPVCPTCKSDRHVTRHGFNSNHIGREMKIVGLTENYFILTCRYKCSSCHDKRKDLEKTTHADNDEATHSRLKYTFMGWDPESLPLTAFGAGDEFPAILTWRAGLDKTLVDMMRPEFDKGTRPEAFSDMIPELHAKNFTRSWLRYEREFKFEKRKINGQSWDDLGSFDDEEKWADKVPTGPYIGYAYKRVSATLRCHFSKEVKKRGANHLSTDVSYKEPKNLCQHKGHSIFNGLVTATNEIGEVRLQYHVVSDSHDQSKTP